MGWKLLLNATTKAYSMGLAFFVNTGARDESPELAGVSHFLEHMVFKGTPNRTAADVNRQLDEIGSHSNAYTSEEHTVYYAAMLPDYQGGKHSICCRTSCDHRFGRMTLITEKKVIIEEIHKYDNQPPFGAAEKCIHLYFGDHPLGNSILGTAETVTNLNRDRDDRLFRATLQSWQHETGGDRAS